MARLIKHTAQGPSEVKTKSGDSVWICRCGLTSDSKGQCDGSHNSTKGEAKGKLYSYDKSEKRQEVSAPKAA